MKTPNDPRHLARRFALQVLFAWTANRKLQKRETTTKQAQRLYYLWLEGQKQTVPQWKHADYDLAKTLVKRVVKFSSKLDQLIAAAAPEWPLDQIAAVDLSVLRLALSELTRKTPPLLTRSSLTRP